MPPTITPRSLTRRTAAGERRLQVNAAGQEERVFDGRLSVRAAGDRAGEGIPFEGYAALFNSRTFINDFFGGFLEEVAEGAFAETITEHDIRQLFNHNPDQPLARNQIESGVGSLRLSEDDAGLLTESDMVPTSFAEDLARNIDAGVVTQQSFSFSTLEDEWSETQDGELLRRLIKVRLWDVGPVTFPAYTDTTAGLRSRLGGLERALGFDEMDLSERSRVIDEIVAGDVAAEHRAAVRAACDRVGALVCDSREARPGIDPSVVNLEADLMERGLLKEIA